MSYRSVTSAFEAQLRSLCLRHFPCGQGSWALEKEPTTKSSAVKDSAVKDSVRKSSAVKDRVKKSSAVKDSVMKSSAVKDRVKKSSAVKDSAVKDRRSERQRKEEQRSERQRNEEQCSQRQRSERQRKEEQCSQRQGKEEQRSKNSVRKSSTVKDRVKKSSAVKNSVRKSSAVKDSVTKSSAVKDSVTKSSAVKDSAVKDSVRKSSAIKDRVKKSSAVKDSIRKSIAVKDSVTKSSAVKDSAVKYSVRKSSAVKDRVKKSSTVKDRVKKSRAVKDRVKKSRAVKDRVKKSTTVKNSVRKSSAVKDSIMKSSAVKDSAVKDSVRKSSAVKDNVMKSSTIGAEEPEDLIELLTSPLSPWRQEEEEEGAWSPQAAALRKLSVRAPAHLSTAFIYEYFTTLRLVNKGVSIIDAGVLRFSKLEELVLTANHISDVLSAHLPATLRVSSLQSLCQTPPPCLQHLGLGLNCLGSCTDTRLLTASFWPGLVSLDLSWSGFTQLLALLDSLATLPRLRTLWLEGNPLAMTPAYPGLALDSLPRLLHLDGRRVTPDQRHRARGMAKLRGNTKQRSIAQPTHTHSASSTAEFPVVSYGYLVTYEFLPSESGGDPVTPIDLTEPVSTENSGGPSHLASGGAGCCERHLEEGGHTAPPAATAATEHTGSEVLACP
ncbi:hypothetical protein JZ751_013000, partial [Albula glossodonta]